MRHEVPCTRDGLGAGGLQVGKLLPLWIFADLPPVQHIKIEAWHWTQAPGLVTGDRSREPCLSRAF